MKNLKTYEYWTTNTSSGVKVNYGDTPNVSEFVMNLIDYINENFNFITNMYYDSGFRIEFQGTNIEKIIVRRSQDNEFYIIIKKVQDEYERTSKYIKQEDFNYFKEYFENKQIIFRDKQFKKREDDILNIINPIKKSAKKYNI